MLVVFYQLLNSTCKNKKLGVRSDTLRIIVLIIIIITAVIILLGSTSEPQLFAECLNVTLGDSPGRQGDSPLVLHAHTSVRKHALCMLSARDWMQRGGDACCMLMSLI